MAHKSVTVVIKSPARYHIVRYNSKGLVVKERWANTSHRADQEAGDLGGEIIHKFVGAESAE